MLGAVGGSNDAGVRSTGAHTAVLETEILLCRCGGNAGDILGIVIYHTQFRTNGTYCAGMSD